MLPGQRAFVLRHFLFLFPSDKVVAEVEVDRPSQQQQQKETWEEEEENKEAQGPRFGRVGADDDGR